MDWMKLARQLHAPPGASARARRLAALGEVVAGTVYNGLPYSFADERGANGEYIPLSQRRPTVRTGLCRTVVDQSVSLLFGAGHWPSIRAAKPATAAALASLVKQSSLIETMVLAAKQGSIGSSAILFHVIDHYPVFRVLSTVYLTPSWGNAGRLRDVTERYRVSGAGLVADGYQVAVNQDYWFQRTWDAESEIWFWPQSLAEADLGVAPQVDMQRTFEHRLGFVPVVWIKNLPGGDTCDGACTFEAAIDTVIEIDYLLSQAGRALKYGSDPTLVLKTGAGPSDGPVRFGGAATALELPPEGDAKLLEINGDAATAVLAHVRYLRSLALESIHGNRSDSDRATAAQSGRAIELMHQALILLADQLRVSYGESGLLSLLRMVCAASQLYGGVIIGEDDVRVKLDPEGLALHWPPYFPPTVQDQLALAQGLVTAKAGSVISAETATLLYASATGLADPAAEVAAIKLQEASAAQ